MALQQRIDLDLGLMKGDSTACIRTPVSDSRKEFQGLKRANQSPIHGRWWSSAVTMGLVWS